MIAIPPSIRIYLCTTPTDMRKSFDGLYALVVNHLQLDPFTGNLFLFLNRRRDRLKLLYWDHDGLALWCKRLEKGTFQLPQHQPGQTCCSLSSTDFSLLLNGIDLDKAPRRPRYQRSDANR